MSTVMMIVCDLCDEMARPPAGVTNNIPEGWKKVGSEHICAACQGELAVLKKSRKKVKEAK